MPSPESVVESTASGNLSFVTTVLPGKVETMSRSQIASRVSVSEGYLTYNFGAELRMLSQKHRNRKVYEKELRDKDPNSLFIGPSRMEFREVRQPTQAGC